MCKHVSYVYIDTLLNSTNCFCHISIFKTWYNLLQYFTLSKVSQLFTFYARSLFLIVAFLKKFLIWIIKTKIRLRLIPTLTFFKNLITVMNAPVSSDFDHRPVFCLLHSPALNNKINISHETSPKVAYEHQDFHFKICLKKKLCFIASTERKFTDNWTAQNRKLLHIWKN